MMTTNNAPAAVQDNEQTRSKTMSETVDQELAVPQSVLITGGTGSFGHRMVRHLLDRGCERIHVLSRDEAKQDQMRHELGDRRVRYFLGDVRDLDSIRAAVQNISHVFHAAALKQVPSAEFFPMQAVKTNVNGSENVIKAAEAAGVESVVCLSTDKAVYPVNAMGMTKALMEKVAQAHGLENPQANAVVACVRYGNVLYSRGSVVPLFINQLKADRPITVTDPDMTRFMMSLDQSVDLVQYALTNAEQGDLFIRKVPSCTIGNLAKAVCEIFQREPEINIIGTRHGEKQSEQLATREELARAVDHGSYFRVTADKRQLDYTPFYEEGSRTVSAYEDYDSHTARHMTIEETKELLLDLPEVQTELRAWGLA
ncbi:SDR family NAD(P)-dependent oxidoreductase [Micrococcus terreus]